MTVTTLFSPVAMSVIRIEKLEVKTLIGVYEHEKEVPQSLYFDIELEVDTQKAEISDSLEDTVDYRQMAKSIEKLAQSKHWNLVESLAAQTLALVCEDPLVVKAKVRVNKPDALSEAGNVAVEVEG